MRLTVLALLASALLGNTPAPQDPDPVQTQPPVTIALWPHGPPGTDQRPVSPEIGRDYWVRNIRQPALLAFPAKPAHNTGAAIVIPGRRAQIARLDQ